MNLEAVKVMTLAKPVAQREQHFQEDTVAVIQSIDLITTDPSIRGGRPCIGGTGIRVTDIAIAQMLHGRTPDEIGSDYAISLAQVHAALAYYYQHKADLDADIRDQFQTAQDLKERRVGSRSSLLPG
jgi:uncharacterized protein (DUF433 family)